MLNTVALERVYICYEFRITFLVRKLQAKNKKAYKQTIMALGSRPSELPYKIAEICKQRKYQLIRLISYQAIKVSFAYYQDQQDMPFLEASQLHTLPLPYAGAEVSIE